MQCARQDVAEVPRRAGPLELAEQALRALPDPVGLEFAEQILQSYGVTKDGLTGQTAGSP
jgi:hypothetical protein